MAVGAFTITSARETVIDFTYPYIEDDFAMIVTKPVSGSSDSSSLFSVFRPFTPVIWILVLVAIFVCSMLFYGVLKARKKPTLDDYTDDYYTGNNLDSDSFVDTLFGMYSQYMWQNVTMELHSLSGRCIMTVWLVFSVLITSSYTTDLIGYLTVSNVKPSINSLEDLANSETVMPLTFPGSSVISFFGVR